MATFTGSLMSTGPETTWNGNWRIEGTTGVLTIQGDRLRIFRGKKVTRVEDEQAANPPGCLEDFLTALQEAREPETSGRDYLRTQALVHYAIQSSEANQVMTVMPFQI